MEQARSELTKLADDLNYSRGELEACRRKLAEKPDIDIEEIKLKEKITQLKEEKFNKLLANLDSIMKSLDTNFMCLLCMETMASPVTCVPCGHNFCAGCHKDHQLTTCPKCDAGIKGVIGD